VNLCRHVSQVVHTDPHPAEQAICGNEAAFAEPDASRTAPGTCVTHLGAAPAFSQYATHDAFVPVVQARHYFESSSGPKEMKFHDSTHSLNAQARSWPARTSVRNFGKSPANQ